MPKVKKIPMRMCIACHEMKAKKEMLRVVKNKEGEVFIDFTGIFYLVLGCYFSGLESLNHQ